MSSLAAPPPVQSVRTPGIASQAASFGAVQILSKLRVLIAVPVLARLIGVEGYGVLSVLMAFAAMVQVLVLAGVNTALTVHMPWVEKPGRRSREFWGVVQVAWGIAAAAAGCLWLARVLVLEWWFPAGMRPEYFVLSLLLIPLHTTNHLLSAQVINNRQAGAYAARVAATSAAGLCLLVLGAWRWGLLGVLTALVAEQALTAAAVGALILRQDAFVPLRRAALAGLARYYTYGAAIMSAGFCVWIVESSDRLLIGRWLPIAELGAYQVAYSVCAHIGDLATPLFSALLPATSAAISRNDHAMAQSYLERSYRLLVLLYCPLVLWLSVSARDILTVIGGLEFSRAAAVMPWVAAGVALNQLLGVYSYTLHSHKRGQVIVASVAAAGAVNLTLNVLCIRRYGIMAAAVSTAAAYAVHFLILRMLARRLLPVGLDRAFLFRVAVAACAMAVVTAWAGTAAGGPLVRLALSAVCGGAAFAGLVFLLEGNGGEARRSMRQVMHLVSQPTHR
jgi:O-antigen/teichoic acid export membrane protein